MNYRNCDDEIINKILTNGSAQHSEMAVFTKAKELSKAVFMVTQDPQKWFRFPLFSRIQDLPMVVVGHHYRANEIFIEL